MAGQISEETAYEMGKLVNDATVAMTRLTDQIEHAVNSGDADMRSGIVAMTSVCEIAMHLRVLQQGIGYRLSVHNVLKSIDMAGDVPLSDLPDINNVTTTNNN